MCKDYAVKSDLSILMPTAMKIAIFWEGMPRGPFEIDRRFGRNYVCSKFYILKMEAAGLSQTSITLYQSTPLRT